MNNIEKSSEVKTKKITLGFIIGWILGILFVVIGFMAVISSDTLSGVFAIAIAVVVLPPITTVIEEKYHFVLSGGVKTLLVIFLLFGLGYYASHKQDQPEVAKEVPASAPSVKANNPPAQEVKETVRPAPMVVLPVVTKPVVAPPTPKSYQEVFSFSGSGAKKSEPFTISGSRFKIKYDCQGDLCQAFLYPIKSKLPEIIMNTTGTTKDETIIYGSGDYYIEANTIGSYTMSVEDYR